MNRKPGRPLGSTSKRRLEADAVQTGANLGAEDILEDESTELTLRERTGATVKAILETPEVAKWFAEGKPDSFIAARIGCSISSVRSVRASSHRLADHLDALSHRILSHLGHRSLEDENLKDLMVTAAVAIDKGRLIRGEATSRTEIYGKGALESVKIAVFGLPRPQQKLVGSGKTGDSGDSGALETGDDPGGELRGRLLESLDPGEEDPTD